MAISRVGSASAASNTLTLPAGIQNRDLIIAFAGRENSVAPTVPSGWTRFFVDSSLGVSIVGAFCYATGSGDFFDTWANAEAVSCVVYRSSASDQVVSVGQCSASSMIASTTFTFSQIASMAVFQRTFGSGEQWRVSAAFLTEVTNAGLQTYTGMSVIQSLTGSSFNMIVCDSGADVTPTGYGNVSVTISPAATSRGMSIEIYETKFPVDSSGGYYNPFRNPVFGG